MFRFLKEAIKEEFSPALIPAPCPSPITRWYVVSIEKVEIFVSDRETVERIIKCVGDKLNCEIGEASTFEDAILNKQGFLEIIGSLLKRDRDHYMKKFNLES